jgi:hypothetical protein
VLHRRTNTYFDLLPLDAAREEKLKQRVSGQHHAILEELRAGTLKLAQQGAPAAAPAANDSLALELLNAKSWLSGKRATLQVLVFRKADGAGVSGARVTARIEGAAEPSEYSTATGTDGKAQLGFEMPRLAAAECALVIEGYNGKSQARLQFQLRAKPKIPAAG